jgi:DNA polymerase
LPESEVFLETYLREIGVQTPVSLLACGHKKTDELLTDEPVQTPALAQQAGITPVDITSQTLKTLDELSQDASSCRLCGLADTRNNVVFGAGNAQADLVFIGEAPGRDEDIQGEPFVGRAGQLLDRMLDAIELDRQKIYIMNTIKCRPPNNRDPKVDEVQSCNLWFEQQLNLLQPKMLCLLGRVAAQTVLENDAPLGSLRGRWHDYNGIPVWVTYHPAYLLRSPQQKHKSWHDFIVLSRRLRELTAHP